MDFYNTYILRYLLADDKTRQASRDHWLMHHKENVASGRNDMIIFSAQMLAAIDLADDFLKTHTEVKANECIF